MKKIIITTALSVLLFLAAVAAGLNVIFSVSEVQVTFTAHSEQSREDAAALQTELNAFVGESSISLELTEVEEIVKKYPYFRVLSLEKKYPQTIQLAVEEREERYAIAKEGGFTLYDKEGVLLGEVSENKNRIDGAENIVMTGVEAGTPRFEEAVKICAAMEGQLGDIRMSVREISLTTAAVSDRSNDYFTVVMREGFRVQIYDTADRGEEKATLAAQFYLAETQAEQIITGEAVVFADEAGNLQCHYRT